MNEISLKRKEARLHQLIADIVTNDITNSNVIDPVVMDIQLSPDLSHVKVFVSLFKNEEKGIEALNNAAGYVKKVLSKSLDWRKVPSVHFHLDTVSKNGYKIDEIIRQIKNEN
ncbi:30S ribosome-binding factor RbfA [Mycoplasma sp. 2045]|uniref:30S ribosome-binding factor RbfA n=1 Tax=unclassified Mycoplasma TaxID=2683645 RepID=UPI00211BF694|nr:MULTISPECIES: 30S ribosome-binding factor RbfA [unclassified Mycoplasma]MEA4134216.1 30S ribosome-binding factor RbfA [Mycoplasma sp. 2704]MEA4162552.1 30S ribosome-binding factor RbfA [Mycoplasma sp. 4404]MEA4190849.1 30S ribosome-binding factor RbfA [Mycoplasma sp. 2248]MEA4276127.1 30S ribosome-binding factor RbfA [Mycoplasma sp. 21DD0573]MEA4333558.1 30S ribosome-binding factor RbfA [Mycoplasma sp. 1232]